MFVKQLYTNCLAEAAYYIESEGEAAVIDPLRETHPYIALAEERGAAIKYVFETHFHADFVSGHIDLAEKTGALIVFGPGADTRYKIHAAKDEESFKIGKVVIKVLHTPGHTLESSCYLLLDENNNEYAVFTGDTLFVGDVGRPDLLDDAATTSKTAMAAMLYDSLNIKIKKLPDDVIVYPAHGPGSSCGKNIGKETWSTIGQQKLSNYALKEMSKEEFVNVITSGLLPPPQYFFRDAKINKTGYDSLDAVMTRNLKALSAEEFEKKIQNGALVLDTRTPDDFEKGFVKGAVNIGLNGTFAVWVGTLLNIDRQILLVTAPGKEQESVLRLARVGYDNVCGYLQGGIDCWKQAGKAMDTIHSIDAGEFARIAAQHKVLDVRKETETAAGHVKGAVNIPLADLPEKINQLDSNESYLVHCAGGYRSMIACSVMKASGFVHLKNVSGGFSKIKETAVHIVCPATTT